MENVIVTDDPVTDECFVRLAIGLQCNEIKIFIEDPMHNIDIYRGLPLQGKGIGEVLANHVGQMIFCYMQELDKFYKYKKESLPDEHYEIDQAHTLLTLQARSYFFSQCVYYFDIELAHFINTVPFGECE